MKIFDCFIYHNEDLILDLRLNILSEYVEKFIIVEAAYDHQGNKKKLNFSFKRFDKFKNKIKYLVIEEFPKNISNWDRENFQRNFINEGLNSAEDEDLIIISDVDEIPDLSKINNLGKNKLTVFEQKMFYYKFNLLNESQPIWLGSKMCKKKFLKSPQWLRSQKVKKKNFFKFYQTKWNVIKNGGWHFSFLMSSIDIKKKLSSYAHAEYNTEYYKNLSRINKTIKNRQDLFERNFSYKKVKIDNTYPKYFLENLDNYKEWIS